MKKITFLFTFLTITLSFGQNLLSSGDFEGLATGKINAITTPWYSGVVNTTQQPSVNNNNLVTQDGSAQFMTFPNDFTYVSQSFTAVAGTEYTLSFWYQYIMGQGQIVDPADGTVVQIRSDADNSVFDPAIGTYLDPTTTGVAEWKKVTINFIAPQTNLRLYIQKQSRNANGTEFPNGLLNNGARFDDFRIEVAATASLEDLAQFSFKSSPNPVKDVINLSAAKNIDKIEIYNLLGQQVESRILNSNNNQVNVSNLTNGIYLVKAFIEDAVGTYKFVKQ